MVVEFVMFLILVGDRDRDNFWILFFLVLCDICSLNYDVVYDCEDVVLCCIWGKF